jgi:hypothetical protein
VPGVLERAREIRDTALYRRRYGFEPPPVWTDLTHYEPLIDAIVERGILDVPGDFVEIGAFLGGGTYKLAKLLERRPAKRLVVMDIFHPDVDVTECSEGIAMRDVYADWTKQRTGGRNQREVFDEVTRGLGNIDVVVGDTALTKIPSARIAFAFIDGNHDPAYVRSDFEKVWAKLSPGGLVAFHDYGFNLPQVTEAIHRLIGEHAAGLSRVWPEDLIMFAQRRQSHTLA